MLCHKLVFLYQLKNKLIYLTWLVIFNIKNHEKRLTKTIIQNLFYKGQPQPLS